MRSAVALRHVACEDLGILKDVLSGAGYRFEYREAGVDSFGAKDVAAADLLVVLGGPIGVYDQEDYPFLVEEIAVVRERLLAGRPTLGICLGAQIMAAALGKRVYPSGVKELGWAPLSLTAAGRSSVLSDLDGLLVLHWHGDTFDLPEGSQHLAKTDAVTNQAFALGNYGLALQFHLEAEPLDLERWYIAHAGEIAATPGVSVGALRKQAARHGAALSAASRRVFTTWLARL